MIVGAALDLESITRAAGHEAHPATASRRDYGRGFLDLEGITRATDSMASPADPRTARGAPASRIERRGGRGVTRATVPSHGPIFARPEGDQVAPSIAGTALDLESITGAAGHEGHPAVADDPRPARGPAAAASRLADGRGFLDLEGVARATSPEAHPPWPMFLARPKGDQAAASLAGAALDLESITKGDSPRPPPDDPRTAQG